LDAGYIAGCIALLSCAAAAGQTPVFYLGPDIAAPFVVSKPAPEYSDEARLAKVEGSVMLSLVVDPNGQPRDIQVVRPLGLGLDEKAVENARHWQFKPGMMKGNPVAVIVNEEVFFRPQRSLWDWHVVRAAFRSPAPETRPAFIKVKFPATVDLEENAAVTLTFDVGPNGVPLNVVVVKSSDAKWENELVTALRDGWRFRPGVINGKPATVPAWFEFVRGSHSPIPAVPIPPEFIAR
jgi:TonB family protein